MPGSTRSIPLIAHIQVRCPRGVMEILRATFDARGAVSMDELDEIFEPTAMRLVQDAVELFLAR